jgi:hypothetical protein
MLPDVDLATRVVATRCELALCGPPSATDDPTGRLIAIDQLVRMGEKAEPWVLDVAHALELMARSAARPLGARSAARPPVETSAARPPVETSAASDWVLSAALDAADRVLSVAGEARARRDLTLLRSRLPPTGKLPEQMPGELGELLPMRALALIEQQLVALRDDGAQLLGGGLPSTWVGANLEVFGIPTDANGTISFAIRWHGERPAILWEQVPGEHGPLLLSSPVLAPQWATSEVKGEALWPVYG